MPKLIIHHADGSQVKYGLNGKVFTIGRADNNDIVLPDGSSSSYHAVLKLTDSGDFAVTDLESTNHTKVNGRQIQTITLRNGDQVVFGDTMALYESEVVAPAENPAPPPIASKNPPPRHVATRHMVPNPRAAMANAQIGGSLPGGYSLARPAAGQSYSASDGCFALVLLTIVGAFAFLGGLMLRHAQDHKDKENFINYVQAVVKDHNTEVKEKTEVIKVNK